MEWDQTSPLNATAMVVQHMAAMGLGTDALLRVALGSRDVITAAIALQSASARDPRRTLILRRLEDASDALAAGIARGERSGDWAVSASGAA